MLLMRLWKLWNKIETYFYINNFINMEKLDIFSKLPKELLIIIWEYDPTFHLINFFLLDEIKDYSRRYKRVLVDQYGYGISYNTDRSYYHLTRLDPKYVVHLVNLGNKARRQLQIKEKTAYEMISKIEQKYISFEELHKFVKSPSKAILP